MNSYTKGHVGEDFAQSYFEKLGHEIIGRNFRCPQGEIDLIVKKNSVITFVEVKTWDTLGSFDLHYVVNNRKIKRIINASRVFLRDYKGRYNSYDYDVLLLKEGKTIYEHYRNILLE